jgi:PilZ domain
MSDVLVYERAAEPFAAGLAKRGHHIVYRANDPNHCPGCGRSHWYVGRISAECGFCGTAIPLAEARVEDPRPGISRRTSFADQRKHARTDAPGRELQLLIDGSPTKFALHNISEGGVMGEQVCDLAPGTAVHVRFEGGVLVPAVVKWVADGHVGLAFTTRVMLDRAAKPTN